MNVYNSNKIERENKIHLEAKLVFCNIIVYILSYIFLLFRTCAHLNMIVSTPYLLAQTLLYILNVPSSKLEVFFFFLVLLYQYVLLVVTLFAWVCEHPLEHGKVTSGHILK